ncbi:MAG: hypothetical protein E7307_01300 [Butyrivibrio sp.]|nr:hypothetical protein [Butyrivibrio sp.]
MRRFDSRVREYFFVLGMATIILGAIIAIIVAFKVGRTDVSSFYRTKYERNWGLTLGIFFAILGPSVFSGSLLIAISEVLEGLEVISNNTANLGIDIQGNPTTGSYTSTGFNSAEALNKLSAVASGNTYQNVSAGSWVCPDCGKTNRSFDQTCSSCGAERK